MISFVAIDLVFIGGFTIFNYLFDLMRYGPVVTRRLFPQQLIFGSVFIISIILNSLTQGNEWDTVKAALIMGVTLLAWIGFAILMLRRPVARPIVLNIGRPNDDSQYWLSTFLLLLGLGAIMFYLGLTRTENQATAFAYAVCAWSAGIIYALINSKEVLLTEQGIRTGFTGIKWNKIEDYVWSEADRGDWYLFLKFKHRPPLFNKLIWRLSGDLRQAVNDILVQRASEAALAQRMSVKASE